MKDVINDSVLFPETALQYRFHNQGTYMPNVLIKLPQAAFSVDQRKALAVTINEAAAAAEQMPQDLKKRFVNWITIDEVAHGMFTCGGADVTGMVLPCIAMIYLPTGVLDGASRASYIDAIHAAFAALMPADDRRQLATSVILHEIPEGQWGANGQLWRLPDFAKAAGYAHLQSLV
jgi:phenylpyruvate tautomerase PptA (4-oxalocrotonate tautomerase family)